MEGYKVLEQLGMMAEPLWVADQLTEQGKDPSKKNLTKSQFRVSNGCNTKVSNQELYRNSHCCWSYFCVQFILMAEDF